MLRFFNRLLGRGLGTLLSDFGEEAEGGFQFVGDLGGDDVGCGERVRCQSGALAQSGRSLMSSLSRSTQIRRLMQTPIAWPSIASSAAHLILSFCFGDFLELRINLGEFGFVQAQLGDAAFVVDRDRGLVDDGWLDVVGLAINFRSLVILRKSCSRTACDRYPA